MQLCSEKNKFYFYLNYIQSLKIHFKHQEVRKFSKTQTTKVYSKPKNRVIKNYAFSKKKKS